MDLPIVTSTLAPYDPTTVWIVAVAFVVAFFLAAALGGNDAANSVGTAVGAKVFTLKQAIIVASVFESLGAITLGARVSDTVRSGLFDAALYDGYEELLMVGQLSALTSVTVWLFVATYARLPVSGSHSIVGASLGFHIAMYGTTGVQWNVIVEIVISWVASPVLSGVLSCAIYLVLKYTVIDRKQQLRWGLLSIPFWYFLVVFINAFSITIGMPIIVESTDLMEWLAVWVSLGLSVWVCFAVIVFLIPYTKRKMTANGEDPSEEEVETGRQDVVAMEGDIELKEVNEGFESDDSVSGGSRDSADSKTPNGYPSNVEDPDVVFADIDSTIEYETSCGEVKEGRSESKLTTISAHKATIFSKPDKTSEGWSAVKDTQAVTVICGPLQGLSACFASFAHGGNDVGNAIGPLIGIYLIFQNGRITTAQTPVWILLYGGLGITVGLILLGWRVIRTIGSDLTPITPSTGFSINLGAAATVLIASNLGIPVSTTHCLVGSVAFVGLLRNRKAIDVRLLTGIVSAWIITLPVTVLLSAAIMSILQHTVPGGVDMVPMMYNDTTPAGDVLAL